jgi:3-(methylthio)propanoyl-CoA dehydrogenase
MYRAPVREVRFVLEELLGARALAASPGLAEYSDEIALAVLEEAARFAENVLEPLNHPGDIEGARWTVDGVVSAPGFREAYRQFVAGGWPALGALPEFGGQRLPRVLVTAVAEFWGSANLAFKLGPMLTHGAVHALELSGSAAQKERYLPRMVSGEWSGTMVLTEPQAGSDLGQVRTRAVAEGDHYRLYGQKIFITWGDHDLTANTIHMVLGRLEGAPPGVKGISLFIVPKVLVNADGSLGERNDVRCLSIEEKLGIHASPTCVLAFGEHAGAVAELVGEPGHGLEYMFIMMNSARLSVGSEGYAVGERAFQRAAQWARTRVQGRPPAAAATAAGGPPTIIHHPDVKRMLLLMKSQTEASRALTLYTALQFDLAAHAREAPQRSAAQARGELLTPIVKGWCTEIGNEVADIGVQVHGGMGYIEETGAAQYLRDVRITTIYEGTTGIQSNDLIGRKLARDRGAAMSALLADMERELHALAGPDPVVAATRAAALEAVTSLRSATQALLAARPEAALAVSVPYLKLCGYVAGGWLLAKSAAIAAASAGAERAFYAAKLSTAAFYAAQVLPTALALARVVERGAASVIAADAALI